MALAGYFWVQSLPRRVMIFTLPASSRACMRYPSSLISCSQSGPSGACLTRAASCGFTQVGRDVRSTLRVGVIVETISQKRHDGRHNRYETSADDGCLCDRIRYEITQEPRLIYTCHRTECP